MDITTFQTQAIVDTPTVIEDDDILNLDLSLMKKKKKNKNRVLDDTEIQQTTHSPMGLYSQSTENYSYEFLIQRVFGTLYANNPELTQRPTKTRLQAPHVLREGTKKTVVTNFANLCKELNRDVSHTMSFMLSELSANGSIDGTNRLILRGRFDPKAIESVARKYIYEYVMCHGCKCLDTIIVKDKSTRLTYIQCNLCHSSASIKPIVSGFRAKI